MTAKELWDKYMKQINDPPNNDEVLQDLLRRYSEKHRAYHTMQHIIKMLMGLEYLKDTVRDLPAVTHAIWCHDAFLDPARHDNEEQSVLLSTEYGAKLLLPNQTVNASARYIMITKHRVEQTSERDGQIVMDLDLMIFGAPTKEFDEYEAAIRQEYSFASEDAFRRGRSAILEEFLKRQQIFRTRFCHEHFETKARENLARSIQKLKT